MRWPLLLISLAMLGPAMAAEPLPSPLTLEAALEYADNTHPEIQLRLVELEKTRAQLEERKVIDKAKGLIMAQHKCSEDEAYKALRKLRHPTRAHLLKPFSDGNS